MGRERWYANGTKYEGQWESNWRTGYGIGTWVNGDSYSGVWKNDKRHGKGKMVQSMKVSGKVTGGLAMESAHGLTGILILVFGRTTRGMGRERWYMLTEVFKRENGKMTSLKDD